MSWQCVARINFCKAIKVNNTSYPTSLQKCLYEHPNARGPQTLSEFWRNVLKAIRKLDWKIIVNRIDSIWGRRITYAISYLGKTISNSQTQKPISTVLTPEFLYLSQIIFLLITKKSGQLVITHFFIRIFHQIFGQY